MENPATREREFRALEDAANRLNSHNAIILSDANENDLEINGMPVQIRSIAEWLIFK
jgi:hypothetical protein